MWFLWPAPTHVTPAFQAVYTELNFFSYREVNDFACFLVPQVHLVNLYYPYAKHVGVPNPFGNQIQLISLEKVVKTKSNGYDINQRKNVII